MWCKIFPSQRLFPRYHALGFGLSFLLSTTALADSLTGPADSSRIKPEPTFLAPMHAPSEDAGVAEEPLPITPIPEESKSVRLMLNDLKFEGMTAFFPNQMSDLYAGYLGKEITLDKIYLIANKITERYRDAGYFLSLAYIPNQRIQGGVVTLKVVEGFIGQVDLDGAYADNYIIQKYIESLKKKKPVKSAEVESFLLRLNSLPNMAFRSVLSPLENGEEGGVGLTLVPREIGGKGSVTFDNHSSRYLGPHEITGSYTGSIVPLSQTTFSALAGPPYNKLYSATLNHIAAVEENLSVEASGGVIASNPGYTLLLFDVESISTNFSLGLSYQWIRQRDENLSLKLSFDGRDSGTDLLGTPFTRDHIRAVRASANYDVADAWFGYNVINVTLSQGIKGLGSSELGDPYLSRAQGRPDFTKLELSFSRLQMIDESWSLLGYAAGQWASDPLLSSEEFGYGGQTFGRAFDSSEISGDNGMNGALELRYSGFANWRSYNLIPYGFYDIGATWNKDFSQIHSESGASIGFGVRGNYPGGTNYNLGLAWPLTRDVVNPIYGQSEGGPRVNVKVQHEF